MIKRIINVFPPTRRTEPEWLALEPAAEAEIYSPSPAHPIQAALAEGDERASQELRIA